MTQIPDFFLYILGPLGSAFAVTWFLTPIIIRLAQKNHYLDLPDNIRKFHRQETPHLGGVALFAGLILSTLFWTSNLTIANIQYILFSLIALFIVGFKDDLNPINPYRKLLFQVAIALLLTHWGQVRMTTFYHLFGIDVLSWPISYLLTIFTIVVIINAMNLIDGIDLLAGSITVLAATLMGIWFYLMDFNAYAVLSISLVGATIAFLFYNRTPAKIFLGDSGSLVIGGTLSILAIQFMEQNRVLDLTHSFKVRSVPVITMAILVLPLFDTLRVFIIRLLQKKSPLKPDRNHIHHQLLDLGLTHHQATFVLIFFNVLMILFMIPFQGMPREFNLFLLISVPSLFSLIVAVWPKQFFKIISFPVRLLGIKG